MLTGYFLLKVPWTEALRLIVKNCYKHHGREDLLQVFNEEYSNTVQVQHQGYSGTMMQTINNPDGTLSIIQIDSGPNSVLTLPDGTQATVVHAVRPFGRQREKTCLQGFRQSEIQTSLLSY